MNHHLFFIYAGRHGGALGAVDVITGKVPASGRLSDTMLIILMIIHLPAILAVRIPFAMKKISM